MRRFLSVWLPHWRTARLQRLGAPRDRPFATVEAVQGARVLAAVCPLAGAAGLRVGQKLSHARALCPALEVADADPAADLHALQTLARAAERYTPLALADAPDGLWLDITGCAHMFDNETNMACEIQRWLKRGGIASRVAVVGTTGAAWALARFAAQPEAPDIVAPGQEQAVLARLPVACLRLEPRAVAGLRRLGLRMVGELAAVPRAELSARFGPAVALRLDHAFGAATEALVWPHPPAPWSERLAFAEPIATAEDLGRALDMLTERLCARLAASRKGGHLFRATFFRVDDARPEIAVRTSQPVRDPAYAGKLLKAALDTVDPGFGIDAMMLDAEAVAPFEERQAGLSEGVGAEEGRLGAVLDHLGNRLGMDRVWRVAPNPSHVPERVSRRMAATGSSAWARDPAAARPVRLLRRPEPIEAAAPVPDDPPILFRWRGSLHRLHAAAGPERIAREWWHIGAQETPNQGGRLESDRVRDYYRVEDATGARFWIFRVGRYGDGDARWFLHGLFA